MTPPSEAPRIALVTGSSRGIGATIAHRFAAAGFVVAVNGLPGDPKIDAVVRDIVRAGGVAGAFAADITDAAQVTDLVDRVTSAHGPIDTLVLNATGPQPEAPLTQVGWAEHLDQLAFFVKSPALFGLALVPAMIDRSFGRIVLIDSEVADRPQPGRSAYAAAKGAQIALARSWARELAPHGITVNSVAPGFIPVERHADEPPATVAAYLASVPAGRMGTPHDVAAAVGFLASTDAGFITGQRIVVDGGRGLT
jgi:3-oxoacyl-[acyl-carrier protein] reductase